MAIHNRAGQPAQQSDLINVAQLTAQYYVLKPEAGNAEHAVKFGTSGHRGSAGRHSFNEPHILAIAQAIAEERAKTVLPAPAMWVKILTRSRSLHSFLCWRCWRQTVSTLLCRKIMASRQRLPCQMLSWSITKRRSAGGRYCDYAVAQPAGRRWN